LKKLALLGAGVGLAAGILLITRSSHAADHLDGPAAAGNPMADIGDVYAWMSADAGTVNLAMTVSPADDGTHHFDKSIQYAWHVTSHPGANVVQAFPASGTDTDVICTFTSDTAIQCWVALGTTVMDYVAGDPSVNGITSADGKVKVFAGQRSDPFYFNLGGFKTAVGAVEAVEAMGSAALPLDAAGCPSMLGATVTGELDAALTNPPQAAVPLPNGAACAAGQIDCFQSFDVKAIVVQIDKSLLLSGSATLVSVWGGTYATLPN
jgi:hypothetical protein